MKKRKGVITVVGVFVIFIMLALLSYIYEMGRLTIGKIKVQNASDAAAAAGAAVYSNVRNNATVDYALMEIYKEAAENAAKWQYAITDLGVITGYYKREFKPTDEPNVNSIYTGTAGANALKNILGVNRMRDLIADYHKAFRVQDGMVTRFLTAYEAHIFKFWRIYEDTIGGIQEEHSNVRDYMDKFAKVVALYNLCYVPDKPEVDGLRIAYWTPACASLSRKHFPFVGSPGTGAWLEFKEERDPYIRHDYSQDIKLDQLQSVFAKAQVRLVRTVFSWFAGMDWLRNTSAGIHTHQYYASSAAAQREFSSSKITFLDLLDLRALGANNFGSFNLNSVRDKVIFVMNPDILGWAFGMNLIPSVDNLQWYRPYITPVMQSTTDEPHH